MTNNDPQIAAVAAAHVQAFVDNLPAEGDAISGYVRGGVRYELTGVMLRTLLVDYAHAKAELKRRGRLLGIGVDTEQWDVIAEAEGRRYEGEQTNDTIVGYLAYGRENARIARDAQRARNEELEAELKELRAHGADEKYTLGHGGAYCAHCSKPMREGTVVVCTMAPTCLDCAEVTP